MANGYLYLICSDCLEHPREDVRRSAHYTLFRDFENLNGHARWDKEGLEGWLKRHVEGECSGAQHFHKMLYIIDPARIELTPTLPDTRQVRLRIVSYPRSEAT